MNMFERQEYRKGSIDCGPGVAERTYPGMAHFAFSNGTADKCAQCSYFVPGQKSAKIQKGTCDKYKSMMRRKTGPTFPALAVCCHYFEKRKAR